MIKVANGYGISDATQLVSGAMGLERNDATTLFAHGFAGESSGNPIRKSAPCPALGKFA